MVSYYQKNIKLVANSLITMSGLTGQSVHWYKKSISSFSRFRVMYLIHEISLILGLQSDVAYLFWTAIPGILHDLNLNFFLWKSGKVTKTFTKCLYKITTSWNLIGKLETLKLMSERRYFTKKALHKFLQQ